MILEVSLGGRLISCPTKPFIRPLGFTKLELDWGPGEEEAKLAASGIKGIYFLGSYGDKRC